MKSLLGVKGMSRSEIMSLLDGATSLASNGSPLLEGIMVATLFFESSTRTRLSFEMAAMRLGARTLTFFPEHSSMAKGETLRDTFLTISELGPDILVVRHEQNGVPEAAQHWTGRPVVNAGDGTNEHPTQALADLLTLRRRFGSVDGLAVAIVGDVAHSRVAGSLIPALSTSGAVVTVVGPASLLPREVGGVTATVAGLDEVIGEVDVAYMLRVQVERGAAVPDDYSRRFQLTPGRARRMRPDAVVMHPGPMNRGVEISDEVADGPRSLVRAQVANGVLARMAILAAIGEGLR